MYGTAYGMTSDACIAILSGGSASSCPVGLTVDPPSFGLQQTTTISCVQTWLAAVLAQLVRCAMGSFKPVLTWEIQSCLLLFDCLAVELLFSIQHSYYVAEKCCSLKTTFLPERDSQGMLGIGVMFRNGLQRGTVCFLL